MIWVCRTGKSSCFIDYYIETSKIYLPWEGFHFDLSPYSSMEEFRAIVAKEMNTDNRTSISNWAGQLRCFCIDMQKGDYVLLPHKNCKSYACAKIIDDYNFAEKNEKELYHSRKVELIGALHKDMLSQSMQYTLRAYRTVFRVKNEEEIINALKQNR